MKKFQFRLEKVLKHKEHLFDIAQAKHAEIQNRLRLEENKLENLRTDYSNCLNDMAARTSGKFSVKELGPYYRYLTFTKSSISAQSKVVCSVMTEEQQSREELIAASKDKEALIKLKEKQYAQYTYDVNKEEQDFLDDLNAIKFARELESSSAL